MKYTIEIEKVYENNDLLNILHHIGFKGLLVHKKTGEIVTASSICSLLSGIEKEHDTEYEYKEAY